MNSKYPEQKSKHSNMTLKTYIYFRFAFVFTDLFEMQSY